MTTVRAALTGAVARLGRVGVPTPVRDARRMMAFALGTSRARVTLMLPEPLPEAARSTFREAVERRVKRQPVSQITGVRDFFGREFLVTPAVLDPRPETELPVQLALERGGRQILDLGTGSGAILISCLAEMPHAQGMGVDVSESALAVARHNARRHGVAPRARFAVSDWYGSVVGTFDLILSNPPYVSAAEMDSLPPDVREWEPEIALTPGGDGLGAYRGIVPGAVKCLAPDGWLIVETGTAQAEAVAALFSEAGFRRITVSRDLDGRDRAVSGQIA